MINQKKIEEIARQVHEAIPKEIREFSEDVEKKIRQVLQAHLIRLNLVSREEFDIQVQTLRHIREKLTLLEYHINKLENDGNFTRSNVTSTISQKEDIK